MSSIVRWLSRACALLVIVVIGGNRRSLIEGLRYLRQMMAWQPEAVQGIASDGADGVCYDLVRGTNAERCAIIVRALRDLGLEPIEIPVPDDPLPNVLVCFGPPGLATLYIAHYDKSRETPTYQGASDNTAAVSVLLATARDFVKQPPSRPVALLFTAAEEHALKGATAFLTWARASAFGIAAVINFDMLGRGRLAVRPSALPGFYFWLPIVGDLVFDGRRLRRGTAYPHPDPELVHRLTACLGDELVEYRRFTAYSDSNVFQTAGLPTVSISSDNMYYLDVVWDRDADRVEWVDERNLELARQLLINCTQIH